MIVCFQSVDRYMTSTPKQKQSSLPIQGQIGVIKTSQPVPGSGWTIFMYCHKRRDQKYYLLTNKRIIHLGTSLNCAVTPVPNGGAVDVCCGCEGAYCKGRL